MRAPFNVLVLPYCVTKDNKLLFCVFKRADSSIWQFVAGGGENEEDFLTASKRECKEEANISLDSKYTKLESMCYVTVDNFSERDRSQWGQRYVIAVYCFAVECKIEDIKISHEHTEFRWCEYNEARELLHFDLDKTAIFELNAKLKDSKGG